MKGLLVTFSGGETSAYMAYIDDEMNYSVGCDYCQQE